MSSMNDYNDDAWSIASWKSDIPGKVAYIKHFLSCSQFPECSRKVIHMLEKYFEASVTASDSLPPNPGLYLTAFLDDIIDQYIFHAKESCNKPLSAIHELQLLEVICLCFQHQPSDAVRCGVFCLLFGLSGQDFKDGKVDKKVKVLRKLVSMAVALQCNHVLESMAVWMQKHHHLPSIVLKVTSSVVEDYTCLVPASLPFLQSLASHSPQMASQLMIALISLYRIVSDEQEPEESSQLTESGQPPLSLLKVVASWVSNNPDLCLLTCPTSLVTAGLLPATAAPTEASTLPVGPILGLLRWVVLMPLLSNCTPSDQCESRLLYSKLHLAIIQAFLLAGKDKENPQDEMELEPGEVMDESDTRHLIKGTDLKDLTHDMVKLIRKLKATRCFSSVAEQRIQLALDRFSQTLQVAIATGCVSATKDELLSVCHLLPSNRLLSTVVESLDTR